MGANYAGDRFSEEYFSNYFRAIFKKKNYISKTAEIIEKIIL